MTVQQDVLARAAKRIGYYAPNDPKPGSESGRYWAAKAKLPWLAGPSTSVWWCMLFVSMCLDEVGQINAIGGFSYNTDVTLNRNRSRLVSVGNARPGDIVIYNWGGRGGTDHVGFVEKNLGNGWIQTIEGNTSSGQAGSQSAGNGVWRRQRRSDIAAIIRPAYTGDTTGKANDHVAKSTDEYWWGKGVTTLLQAALGTTRDGIISSQDPANKRFVPNSAEGWEWSSRPQGSRMVIALQKKLGVTADGLFGQQTAKALQKKLKVTQDGFVGSKTVEALYKALKAGKF